jgi:dihydroorotase
VTLVRDGWTVPESLTFGDGDAIVPLAAGEPLRWRVEAP